MASSTTKKVLISRFDRETLAGFVNAQTYLSEAGLELLMQAGSLSLVPLGEIKLVSFVRDFPPTDTRPEMRTFTSRPKLGGLWVRMRFRDGDILDGVMPNNLLQAEPYGFTIVPPDPGSQNQRLFVPRAALSELRVLGVVGSSLRAGRKPKAAVRDQLEMFDRQPGGLPPVTASPIVEE